MIDGVEEPEGSYPFPLNGWVCFHCGEEFSIKEQGCRAEAETAAREHFGADPRWTPLCLEAMRTAPRKLWRRLRIAEAKLAGWADMEERLDYLSGVSGENHDLRNQLDSMRGELLVAAERLAEALAAR